MGNRLPPGPLEIINKQCEQNQGRIIKRIRIHPTDWPMLKAQLVAILGAREVSDVGPFGVPVVKDPELKEGPVCEWDDRDIDGEIKWFLKHRS